MHEIVLISLLQSQRVTLLLLQGFIDPGCGFITLLQLITTSNWHSVMNSVYKASGWWAYIYFILFYLAIDLILLDLMIAIAIEMYNAVSRQSDDTFGEQPGICFEVRELCDR